ncbi:hypothetical protein SH449x_003286 [Pirellulaceae bacterium SH449]
MKSVLLRGFGPLVFFVASFCMVSVGMCQDRSPSDRDPPSNREEELAAKAAVILNNYCFRCHRGQGSSAGGYAFNARDVISMTDDGIVTPGDSESSDLHNAMFRGRMPPRNQAGLMRPTPDEVQTIKEWIDAGAPVFPEIPRRSFVSLLDTMEKIFDHYGKIDPKKRSHYKYFTLVNLWNNPETDERQIRMTRAALAKALNSLSWQAELAIPEAVDERKLIFAVDISKLGWTDEHWLEIIKQYPYQIDPNSILDDGRSDSVIKLRRIEEDMIRLGGNDRKIKDIRADWFITIGLRPGLYHKLLYDLTLPELKKRDSDANKPDNPKSMTDRDLEEFLGVNVNKNIFGSPTRAIRAGFTESGISGQNRLIERHPMTNRGYYWKSYDFLGSNSQAILTEFPLGPAIADDDGENEFSFQHDGGEIIYSLPNGLQGYMLSTAAGARLDAGPIEIVGDALKTSGNQLIVNGLSCVVCHRKGMVEPPDDEVRLGAGVFGIFADKVRTLYPEPSVMQNSVESDGRLFQESADRIFKYYLIDEDYRTTGDGFPLEPVGEVARWYLFQPMNIETIASELYHPSTEIIKVILKNDLRARKIGLGHLRKDNASIKREAWHNIEGRSLMQLAAEVLGYAP